METSIETIDFTDPKWDCVPLNLHFFVQGEMSNSSSSNSLNLMGGGVDRGVRGVVRSRQSSVTGSTENLDTPMAPVIFLQH